MSYIAPEIRRRVAERAGRLCEYCQSQEVVLGMPFEIEHIVPLSAGGETEDGNLCLACPRCNRYKGMRVEATDQETGLMSPLFNPRQDRWSEHFAWSANGLHIVGLTPTGRATIDALQMNNPFLLRARQLWIASGWHPPLAE